MHSLVTSCTRLRATDIQTNMFKAICPSFFERRHKNYEELFYKQTPTISPVYILECASFLQHGHYIIARFRGFGGRWGFDLLHPLLFLPDPSGGRFGGQLFYLRRGFLGRLRLRDLKRYTQI